MLYKEKIHYDTLEGGMMFFTDSDAFFAKVPSIGTKVTIRS